MSAPVDVVAGIRLAARDCRAHGNKMAELELLEIAGAVAELIKRGEYLCRTGEGMIMFRAALRGVGGAA